MSTDYGKPIPIRLSQDVTDKISAAGKQHGKSNQEIMRLALDAGLALLRREGLNLGDAIVDAARRIDSHQPHSSQTTDIGILAEKGTGYSAPKKARNAIAPTIPTDFFVVTRKD